MPEDRETVWVSETEVTAAVDLPQAIDILDAGFAAEGSGAAMAMDKTMVGFDGHGTLHALGGVVAGAVGTKTWAHTAGGADPALLLFDAEHGGLMAVIEAFALGQLRTAATAAVATRRLARPDASRLGVIGTGKQALAQVAAVVAVCPIDEIGVYSRDTRRRAGFAARVTEELGIACSAADSAKAAVEGADVVTLITRATVPVLLAGMADVGTHINAVGAIDLNRREFEPTLLESCSPVVTDNVAQAQQLSSELREFYGTEPSGWTAVRSLAEVVSTGAGRQGPDTSSLFKGMGSGIADVTLGLEVLRRVRQGGGGQTVRREGRSLPTLRDRERTP